jgi:hypothetical protein
MNAMSAEADPACFTTQHGAREVRHERHTCRGRIGPDIRGMPESPHVRRSEQASVPLRTVAMRRRTSSSGWVPRLSMPGCGRGSRALACSGDRHEVSHPLASIELMFAHDSNDRDARRRVSPSPAVKRTPTERASAMRGSLPSAERQTARAEPGPEHQATDTAREARSAPPEETDADQPEQGRNGRTQRSANATPSSPDAQAAIGVAEQRADTHRALVSSHASRQPVRKEQHEGEAAGSDLGQLSVEALESLLLELAADLAARTSRYLDVIAELDRREAWRHYGCRNMAEWVSWRAGVSIGAAREQVRVAASLSRLPRLHEALARGEISYSKARALTRVATTDNEAHLLEVARSATGAQLERICSRYRQSSDAHDPSAELARYRRRYLRTWFDEDGCLRGSFCLPPEEGAMLLRALDEASGLLRKGRSGSHMESTKPGDQESCQERRTPVRGAAPQDRVPLGPTLEANTQSDKPTCDIDAIAATSLGSRNLPHAKPAMPGREAQLRSDPALQSRNTTDPELAKPGRDTRRGTNAALGSWNPTDVEQAKPGQDTRRGTNPALGSRQRDRDPSTHDTHRFNEARNGHDHMTHPQLEAHVHAIPHSADAFSPFEEHGTDPWLANASGSPTGPCVSAETSPGVRSIPQSALSTTFETGESCAASPVPAGFTSPASDSGITSEGPGSLLRQAEPHAKHATNNPDTLDPDEVIDPPQDEPDDPLGAHFADALVTLSRFFLVHVGCGRDGEARPLVVVHVADPHGGPSTSTSTHLERGGGMADEALLRLACDAEIIAQHTCGTFLDLGRARRRPSAALRRALVSRDRGCRFPGCSARAFIEAHHLRHWAHGGDTNLDNLVLLCSFHHRLVHEGGFELRRTADDTFVAIAPTGQVLEDRSVLRSA